VVFLHSDQEYLWPEPAYSFDQIVDDLLNLLTIGWWAQRKAKEENEFATWPFVRMTDCDDAARIPKYFAGRRAG
jgi:hypothetical protein